MTRARHASIYLALPFWLLSAWPAVAHHSAAMFDRKTTQTLHGTVKDFQWTNPHGFIQLLVASPSGAIEWSIEMQDPRAMFRHGWRPGIIKAGDTITVIIHPAWDGNKTVAFVSATDADGHSIGKAASQ